MPRFQKALAQLMGQEEGEKRPDRQPPDRSGTVVSELRARVSTTELEIVSPFAKLFLQNSSLLEGMLAPSDLAGLTLGACRFLCDRHTLPLALRAYLPNAAEHGWTSPHPVIEIAADEQSGLVTSVCTVIEEQGGKIEAILSAALHVERDDTGLARSIQPATGAADECLIHLQLSGAGSLADLESAMRRHLEALGRTRRDSGPLQEELRRSIDLLSQGSVADREAAELLAWFADGRLNVTGFEEIDAASGTARRSLGIYATPPPGIEASAALGPGDACLVKTRAADPAHPGQYLDEFRIRSATPPDAIYRIAGTLAASALRERTSGVPLARTTYKRVLALFEESGRGDDVAERLRRAFDALPLDVVLAASPSDIAALLRAIVVADEQPGIRIQVTPGTAAGGPVSFATVMVPRQHMARSDTDVVSQLVRERVAPILARHFISDGLAVVRMHYTLDIDPGQLRPELVDELTTKLHRILSSWRDATVSSRPRESDAPQPAPAAHASTPEALPDELEVHPEGTAGSHFRLRVAATAAAGSLNDLVAALDDLGLRIVRLATVPAAPAGEVHEVSVQVAGDRPVEAARIAETLRAIRAGLVESDSLSSLCWRAGLGAASIDALRAFCALAESRGVAGRVGARRALVDNPAAAEAFLRAFDVKFDPRLPVANDAQRRRDLATVRAQFEAAASLAEDRIARHTLRGLGELLDEVVRASFFCGDRHRAGRTLALKLGVGDHRQRSGARNQTFVYAPAFEAILLRGGPAARPVLRLADDLTSLHATAALELGDQTLRAGQVTTDPGSAVIALRQSTSSADAADRALREFLTALLTVTDDVIDGELVRNQSVVAWDEADSYFSVIIGERPTGWAETARRVVEERHFWMGEATVTRYDEPVAAAGAWAAVRSLRQGAAPQRAAAAADSGVSDGGVATTQSEALVVVAIGSPDELHLASGARLVAAFDDHEIFLAPSIDAASCAKGLDELRRRGGASWSDFPVDLRGRGGTVVRRDARKIELSEEAKGLLGWTDGGGEELARAVLAIGADLLWVRGSSVRAVSGAEMSGRPSEQLEVELTRIGAAGVVEIGHSLFSPAARVEFALSGRTVHTPATDGVAADLVADRVSNVELVLSLAGAEGAAIETHSTEVAEEIRHIATDLPRRQAVAIGLDQRRSRENWATAAVCIRRLRGDEDTAAGDFPIASELELERRQGSAGGLTRPEIANLRAIVALHLQGAIRQSSLCRDPYLRPWIDDYFPTAISRQFPDLVDRHPLRDEIAALAVTERILEVMGFAFVADAATTHGRTDIDIVKAWCAAFVFGGAQEVWTEVEGAGLVAGSPDHQRHRLALALALERATHRMVELRSVDLSLERMVDRFGGAVGEILRAWPEPLPEARQGDHENDIEEGTRAGLPRRAADHLARISHLGEIVDVCDLAIQINSPRSTVAAAFFGLEPVLRFADIEAMVRAVRHQDPLWGARAEAHLRARLAAARRGLTTEVVSNAAGRRRPVERWIDAHGDDVRAFQSLLGEVKSRGQASSAAVEVLIGALENLARGQRRSR